MNILDLMAAPFAECLVLVAIHTYLGLHVLRRRVIFVDLALAQIAALGTTVGFLFGIMPETPAALIFSMAFTFMGAALFSVTRFRRERVPQEAIIGLIYAISFAVAVLVVEKTKGAEHLKDILVGNLLWVTWPDVWTAAAVYSVIGAVHFAFRKKLLLISDDPAAAFEKGVRVRLWDFIFYMTFGMVIAFSTRVAGVLLVFLFLVAPAVIAFSITGRILYQLLIGWTMGTIVTVIGLYLSWVVDLPSGPAVIAFYGIALVVAGTAVFWARARNRKAAAASILTGVAVTAATVLIFWMGGRWLGSLSIAINEEARHAQENTRLDEAAAGSKQRHESKKSEAALAGRAGGCARPEQISRYVSLADSEQRIEFIEKSAGNERIEMLDLLLSDGETPLFYREEGARLLREAAGEDFGYDPQAGVESNRAALERLCAHLKMIKY